MRLLAAVLLIPVLSGAERKLPAKFEPLARLALAAPPELAANALLRILESGKVKDVPTVVELAQQAFDLAAGAHFRAGMVAVSGVAGDTREGTLARAYGLRLDAVSLQSRAVEAVLPVDPAKARQMLAGISKPNLAPLSCEDALVYDLTGFYRALGAVAQSGFTRKERAQEDHVAFLLPYAAEIRNSAQVASFVATLQTAGFTAAQRDAVVAQINGVLETLSGDPRSFMASVDKIQAAMTPEMAASFRKYYERNTSGKVCVDKPPVNASADGVEASQPEGPVKVHGYWQSSEAQRLQEGARKLRFGERKDAVLSDAQRGTPAWQLALSDYEKQLADWGPAAEKSEGDFYQQKCIVYEALVELIPPGPGRDRALEAFAGLVAGSALQTQSPVEWFRPAQAMLERVRNTNNGEPAKVLAVYEASGNPALVLYAALERAFERVVPDWMSSSGQ